MVTTRQAIWTFAERVSFLQQKIDALQPSGTLAVLEAGCGSSSHFQFKGDVRITGIDISQEQLDRNTVIHEKICADIETYDFANKSFDLIVCWNVMEHLSHPDVVLEKFFGWLKPGGILLIGTPNIFSGKGLITKLTPHWIHVALYRYVLGKKDAGQPGTEPFPTFLRMTLAPRNLERFALDHGMVADTLITYRTPWEQNIRNPFLRLIWEAYKSVLIIISLGRISAHNSELLAVLKRPVA